MNYIAPEAGPGQPLELCEETATASKAAAAVLLLPHCAVRIRRLSHFGNPIHNFRLTPYLAIDCLESIGSPIVSELNQMNIGAGVEAQLISDWQAERDAIQEYNADIRLAVER